jgi:exopolysaccharide biosynthesis protein
MRLTYRPIIVVIAVLLVCLPVWAQGATESSTTWELLKPGMERRIYYPDEGGGVALMVLRLDPALFDFRVHYQPGARLSTSEWLVSTPGTVAFINANFFNSEQMVVDGLLVSDGQRFGSSYQGFGGRFVVEAGVPRVIVNAEQSYRGERLEQAVEGSPVLVIDGQPNAETYLWWRDSPARRSIVAEDSAGRILLMATAYGGMRLEPLSEFLAGSDLEITNAVNLDGGVSTLLYMQPDAGVSPYLIRAVEPVPAILAVYPR